MLTICFYRIWARVDVAWFILRGLTVFISQFQKSFILNSRNISVKFSSMWAFHYTQLRSRLVLTSEYFHDILLIRLFFQLSGSCNFVMTFNCIAIAQLHTYLHQWFLLICVARNPNVTLTMYQFYYVSTTDDRLRDTISVKLRDLSNKLEVMPAVLVFHTNFSFLPLCFHQPILGMSTKNVVYSSEM